MTIISKITMPTDVVEHVFPKLFIHKTSGSIVLFEKATEGTIINHDYDRIGMRLTMLDINEFDVFTGSVTLSNYSEVVW